MVTSDPVADADYPSHVATYHSFVHGVQMAIAAAATVLVLLAYFLL
jgi:hypothetical protein